MTDQHRADIFLYEYRKPGGMHWAFNGLRDCVQKWTRWGIIGMPDPTPGAVALIHPAIESDDAFLRKLRA
jgi:hypothetical protein